MIGLWTGGAGVVIRKTFECSVKAEAREGGATRFRAIASTGAQDRHGEFLDPNGARLVAGAQVLYGHDYWSIRSNIGVLTALTIEDGRVVVDGEFDDEIPEHVDAIIAAKKAKKSPPSLNMLSVGFQPRTVKFKDGTVKRLAPGEFVWPEPGLTYTEWDLVELSFVPVPANPEAELLSARGAGAESASDFRATLVHALESVLGSASFLERLERVKVEAEAPAPPADPPVPADPPAVPPADDLAEMLEAAEPATEPEDEVDSLLSDAPGLPGPAEGAGIPPA